MKKLLSILITAIMCFSILSTVHASEMNFADVQPDAWYYEDVKYAVENGLINGKTENLFAPASSLTGSEAIKLAACINQLYIEGAVTLKNGFPWYKPYVDYCKENGIINEDKNYPIDRPITRGDFVVIFANTLPQEAYTQINKIEYGQIPDVEEGREYYEPAYKLYRAGILTGSGEENKLFPDNPIIRAEVAAIVTRMIDETRRVHFSFEEEENNTQTEEGNQNENNSDNNTFVNVTINPDPTDVTEGNVNYTDGSRNETEDDHEYVSGNVVVEGTTVNAYENVVVNGSVTHEGTTNVNIVALSIKLQPVSFKVTEIPTRATFAVEAVGGVGPYTYQWEKQSDKILGNAWTKMPEPIVKRGMTNTANYSGSTTNTLKVVITKDNTDILKHKYRCVITDANGNTVTSNVVGFDISGLSTSLLKGLR